MISWIIFGLSCIVLAPAAYLHLRCIKNCLIVDKNGGVPCCGFSGCGVILISFFFSWFFSMMYAYKEGLISKGTFALWLTPLALVYVCCVCICGLPKPSENEDKEEDDPGKSNDIAMQRSCCCCGCNCGKDNCVVVNESSLVGYSNQTPSCSATLVPPLLFSMGNQGQSQGQGQGQDTQVTMVTISDVDWKDLPNYANYADAANQDFVHAFENSAKDVGQKVGERLNSGLPKYEDLDLPPPYVP